MSRVVGLVCQADDKSNEAILPNHPRWVLCKETKPSLHSEVRGPGSEPERDFDGSDGIRSWRKRPIRYKCRAANRLSCFNGLKSIHSLQSQVDDINSQRPQEQVPSRATAVRLKRASRDDLLLWLRKSWRGQRDRIFRIRGESGRGFGTVIWVQEWQSAMPWRSLCRRLCAQSSIHCWNG